MELNLDHKNIPLLLIFTLFAVLAGPVLLPSWHIMFFAPFLVVLYYQKSYINCLWCSLLAGLLLDLLAAPMRLGLYAVCYCLATGLLYNQKRHFFADSLSTLPLMTFFFSVVATSIEFGWVFMFEMPISFSWRWFLTDLVYLPSLDAAYAFGVFILPAVLFGKPRRLGKDYFSS